MKIKSAVLGSILKTIGKSNMKMGKNESNMKMGKNFDPPLEAKFKCRILENIPQTLEVSHV